jgi:hypothetical protein
MGQLRRVLLASAATLTLTVAGALVAAAPASAADQVIEVDFNNVTGSTFLAKPMVTAAIPQSVITTQVDLTNGTLTGQAKIADITAHLSILNIGVTSTVSIVPATDLTGTIDFTNQKLSTTTNFTIAVKNVHLDALPNLNLVTPGCTTAKTSSATLTNTTPIDIFNGTTVTGSFSVPAFTHCGLATPLLTLLLSGGGNTLTLDLK